MISGSSGLGRVERGYALVLKGTGRVIGNLTIDSVQERLANLPELRGKRGVGMSFAIRNLESPFLPICAEAIAL